VFDAAGLTELPELPPRTGSRWKERESRRTRGIGQRHGTVRRAEVQADPVRRRHSCRSAAIGSSAEARCAGSQQASAATPKSSAGTPANTER